jgi:hypothetical protein
MTTLREFLRDVRSIVDKNPDALDMEMIGAHGGSGELDEIGSVFIREISYFDGYGDEPENIVKEDILCNDYPFDSIIEVYIGN